MSYPTSSPELPPQPFVFTSPDRVLVRALPHPLASTNKKVTLSLRRTPPSSSSQSSSLSPSSPSSASHSSSGAIALSEPSTAPQNIQIANTSRRSMISTLTSSLQEQKQILSSPSLLNPQSNTIASSVKLERPSPSPLVTTATTSSQQGTGDKLAHLRKYSAQFHKNGMPIKSAMKSPAVTLDVKTSPQTLYRPSSIRSHSSPTPLTSPKYVHFNTQLEHVRLFLQGETPSCVAERETIVDGRQHDRSTSDIKITFPNWKPTPPDSLRSVSMDSGALPMRMESVELSVDQTELEGKILVQNIAFHKHVSVRYTVDFWQSFTEVMAEYEESIPSSSMDRFSFEIPLEMERAMVEKTFCMAVRYQVSGREFWDSNNGMNYQVECKRVVVVASATTASDLSKHMNSLLLGSPMPDYSKPVLRKNLANRYDLSSSLSAAYSQPIAIPMRSSSANTKVDLPYVITMSPPNQTAYRASEYITPSSPSPQNYHHSLYASSPKFIGSYLSAASPPEHFHVGYDQVSFANNKKGSRNSWNVDIERTSPTVSPARSHSFPSGLYGSYSSSPKGSSPISIPLVQRSHSNAASTTTATAASGARPTVESSSYFDLVDRYCFYESSPRSSPYSSYPNSPPAPCIRG
ncbi:hypothetical protein BX616_005772 [Lobosporangium transversale]|uniref:Putative phosphatase regulatory subunit-domain-containing protein n=1 Tax=Lobosporangium transversale TaxID=64571 RepID=A0A1Y2GL85_9FUNG|nr:putative phosphatase regulatory subunit-domain-containing protein [Lobosporangium transversale]KAF9897336.1 hypothetical protein BX616_005772 [Lobosporangium transversale]ORZ14433.1 putative phosphatase regulatory subunit-domain-containing protein [Lobosporangium transversale]|eukprot:XP_021880911.1 putative phosphatase regulatory subunit-domain-containing protein [Lobosporangium transversale]